MGKYENKRKGVNSRRLISLILAACLIFTLAITAYALNLFGIREMFHTKNQDLPVEIDPYIQQHSETVAAREWGATVTESFCDPTRVMVTVSVTGGDKYIIVPTGADNVDYSKIISLNETAAYLWENVAPKDSFNIDDMVALLLAEYEVEESVAREDCEMIIERWKEMELLEIN